MRLALLATVCAFAISGCAAINSRAISYKDGGDRLYVWKSNYSAGLAAKAGGICAQGALTAVATSLAATAKGSGGAPNTPSAELTLGQQQALATINASNNQTAYANIAFFYLCQIANNAKLTPEQIVQMWGQTNLAVVTLGAAGTTTTVSSATLSPAPTSAPTALESASKGATSGPSPAVVKSLAPLTQQTIVDTRPPSSAAGTIGSGVADALRNLSETVKQSSPGSTPPTSDATDTSRRP